MDSAAARGRTTGATPGKATVGDDGEGPLATLLGLLLLVALTVVIWSRMDR